MTKYVRLGSPVPLEVARREAIKSWEKAAAPLGPYDVVRVSLQFDRDREPGVSWVVNIQGFAGCGEENASGWVDVIPSFATD